MPPSDPRAPSATPDTTAKLEAPPVPVSTWEGALGISVVLCCHNGASKLPHALEYLARQRVPKSLTWEVILVDNASTDGSGGVAEDSWRENRSPVPLRVVIEAQLGLAFARNRGVRAAKYSIIVFVDDDNWLEVDYLARAWEIMESLPSVGIAFGRSDGVFERQPPGWFRMVQQHYAIGSLGDSPQDVTGDGTLPWGAGMVMRKSALSDLMGLGFAHRLTGRQGSRLSSCEDSELSLALMLAGWRLRFDPRLALRHFMPEARMEWSYFRKLFGGQCESAALLDPYYIALGKTGNEAMLRSPRLAWWCQCARGLYWLFRHNKLLAFVPVSVLPDGSPRSLPLLAYRSRLRLLLRSPREYIEAHRAVATLLSQLRNRCQ